jgi:outer membrane protein TolC
VAFDAPWNRVNERRVYRSSFIDLERAVRAAQELEDQIKTQVRSAQRSLVRARESISIQTRSVELAQRRVDSTALFLQAGRTQIRDVLEAQEALISARNALTASIVGYRVAELEWRRDLATLDVDEQGLWKENARYDQSNE